MRILETPALTLEPQTTAHADEMFVVLGDPAIYQYENEPPPSLEWLRAIYAIRPCEFPHGSRCVNAMR